MNKATTQELHIALESIYYLHRLGDHAAAESLLKEIQIQLASSPLHEAFSSIITHIGRYEQNIFSATEYNTTLLKIKTVVQNSNVPLYQGWMHFLAGYHSKNESELKLAIQFFHKGPHSIELYEVYYWMNRFNLIPADEKHILYLRTYPVKSIYSLIQGNKYFKTELTPLTQIQKSQANIWLQDDDDDDQQFDCWYISNDGVVPATYATLKIEDCSYLDVYSGLINDRDEYIFLLLSELNCLSYLITAQLPGATLNQLAEFLNKTEQEISELLEQLERLGIKITKSHGTYFIQWDAKPTIIMPRSLKVVGLQEFVKKKVAHFSKEQLIEILQLTKFGADALIKKWVLAGFIGPTNKKNGDEVIWKFT